MLEEARDWWRTWFGPGYLALYDSYLAERTAQEIDDLTRLLELQPPLKILDLGCGQGRHSIELARRGHEVTGVDLSQYLLDVAVERARSAGVTVRWLQGDMRKPPVERGRFDLAVSLFTSFGYFDNDSDNEAVLRASAQVLRPRSRLVLEVLHGDHVLRDFRPREWFTLGAVTVLDERSLDRAKKRLKVHRTVVREGAQETSYHSLRLYGGTEIRELARAAGFARVELFGGWARERLTDESSRLLAVAHREG